MRILIIGQGKIGQQVSNQLSAQFINTDNTVTGMARQTREQYQLNADVNYIQQDANSLTFEQIRDYSHICIIIAPSMSAIRKSMKTGMSAEIYQQVYVDTCQHIAEIQKKHGLINLQRIVYISSTGIYGQDDGEWIDEYTHPLEPKRVSSQLLLQSEQVLKEAFDSKLSIIRASGIYGVDRLMRIRSAKDDNKKPIAEYAWTNRIMDTDLVNITIKVLTIANPKNMYIATDYLPVTSFELTSYLVGKLSSTMPEIDKSLPVSGKRLHSNIPLDWLSYADWQSGYQMILENLTNT